MELSLKAVLIARGIRPPRSHDLAEILRALGVAGVPVPPRAEQIPMLTRYAVEMRYPSEGEPATESDLRDALPIAIEVLAWAGRLLEPR